LLATTHCHGFVQRNVRYLTQPIKKPLLSRWARRVRL
jgi:hypothetical protein